MIDVIDFLKSLDQSMFNSADRARAVLWWVGHQDAGVGMTTAEICKTIENSGHPKQNASRLNAQLAADKKRIHRVPGSKAWRLSTRGRAELDGRYQDVVEEPRAPIASDSIIARTLFHNTRGYIENVVRQINASYDVGLYDCCAVMCRRLLETLIIEVYEHVGRAADIKGNDGHFFMLADLLRTISKDTAFNISRNAQRGFEDFKKLGDLSAHNRRFNAHKSDIDQVKAGLRVSSEELLHLAGLI